MWGSIVGGVLGAATSLFGSNKSAESQQKANEMNMQLAREQMAYQKELAQSQIQWRVEDAKKAGLHPMAALGLSPMSYSPVSGSAVGSTYDYSGVGNSLQQMGQDIDRARLAGLDREERKKALALQDTQTALALKNQELNNQILEQELVSRRVKLFQQLTPGMASLYGLDRKRYAIPGQDDAVMPRAEGTVATGDKQYQFMQRPNGSYTLQPSDSYAQNYEDKALIEWLPHAQAYLRSLLTRVSGGEIDGMIWDDAMQGWVPKDKGKTWRQRLKDKLSAWDAVYGKRLYDWFERRKER